MNRKYSPEMRERALRMLGTPRRFRRAPKARRHGTLVATLGGNLAALSVGVPFLLSWQHDLVPAISVPLALAALGTLTFWAILSRYARLSTEAQKEAR